MKINQYVIESKGVITKRYKIYKEKSLLLKVNGGFFLKEMKINDTDGNEVMRIRRPFSPFKMKFEIIVNDEVRGTIIADKNPLSNDLTVDTLVGLFFVEGNFWANEFTIEDAHKQIAKISRKRFSSKRYGVAILQGQDELFIMGIVMAIEMMIQVNRRRKS